MKRQRIDIASIRREQIVEAAVAVIMEQGLQNLSLSEIEKRAGMSRGQLTYYFPAKEDILLAVFDRLVLLTYQRIGTPGGHENGTKTGGWEWTRHLLARLLSRPTVGPEFECLQYTFLSQIGHREDFRDRLASLYENWRTSMAQGLACDIAKDAAARPVSSRAMATLIQAILHGLTMQRAADPDSFDPDEMAELCLSVLGSYLWGQPRMDHKSKSTPKKRVAKSLAGNARLRAASAAAKGVNGERIR